MNNGTHTLTESPACCVVFFFIFFSFLKSLPEVQLEIFLAHLLLNYQPEGGGEKEKVPQLKAYQNGIQMSH